VSDNFKNLMESMMAYQPSSRPTMVDIIGHPWMRGAVDTQEEFHLKCKGFFDLAVEEKQKANDAIGIDHIVYRTRKSDRDENQEAEFNEKLSKISDVPFRPVLERTAYTKVNNFTMQMKPQDIMTLLHEVVTQEKDWKVQLSQTKWKMSVLCPESNDKKAKLLKLNLELHELEQNKKYVISASCKTGSLKTIRAFNEIYTKVRDGVFQDV